MGEKKGRSLKTWWLCLWNWRNFLGSVVQLACVTLWCLCTRRILLQKYYYARYYYASQYCKAL